jgi:hypothetical protein
MGILGVAMFGPLLAEMLTKREEDGISFVKNMYFKTIPVLFGIIILSLFIPSTNAIYLIAASEAGETVITSESGRETFNHLKEILDLKLEEIKGDLVKPQQQ